MKRSLKTRLFALLLVAVLAASALSGCVMQGERNPTAEVKFSNGKSITIRLYYDKAPNTVKNFISLAQSGFYDGTPVTRIIEYYIVQMGDPEGDNTGNAGYYIKGEFSANGVKNDLLHEEGTVSMARAGDETTDFDTASCQFFITLNTRTSLDGYYAAFGKVTSGMSYVEQISKMDVDANNAPRDEIYIESVTINTYGKDYGEPSTIALPEDR